MSSLNGFLKRHGWIGFVRLAFYPVTSLITTPVRLIQSLWKSSVLLDGRWGRFPHFSPLTGINSLFYWTRALSLYRFGRARTVPYLGLGKTSLAGMFFYSIPSMYLFWIAAAPTILFGMLGWWLSHLIWLQSSNIFVLAIVLGLTLGSTLFYGNLARQNYNVIGWMFFPMGLYGLMTGHWVVAGAAWIFAGFGGVTVLFLGGIYSVLASILYGSLYPILAFIPAGLFLLPRLWLSLAEGGMGDAVLLISKAIGLTESKVKYRRMGSKRLNIGTYYLLFLCVQFLLVTYFVSGNIPYFFLAGILVFFINSRFFRFADPQSIYMLLLSLGVCTAILEFHPLLLISYWLLISPLPKFIGFPTDVYVFDVVPLLAPFDVEPLLDGMEEFLAPVQKGQRVLMAYQDPGGIYENIFDGYRVLLELPLYVSAVKQIHFLPDWLAVFELNYEGAPDFWGREVDDVVKNINDWHADYVVIYQKGNSELELKWEQAGFKSLGRFSWTDYAANIPGILPDHLLPDWWLLKMTEID